MTEFVPLYLYKNQAILSVKETGSDQDYTPFWVINPDFRPIPAGTDLVCVKNDQDRTVSVEQLYDMFNLDNVCLRLLAWLEPTPYTIPLHIGKKDTSLYLSFSDLPSNYKEIFTIYVLKEVPKFFQNDKGRCVPSSQGVSLSSCSVQTKLKGVKPTLLGYLEDKYGKEGEYPVFLRGSLIFAVFSVICFLLAFLFRILK